MNSEELTKKISQVSKSIDGTIGVFALHVEKDTVFSFQGDTKFPLASTYKIPIAIGCLKKVDERILNLEDRVEILAEDIPESSAILDHRHFSYPGISLSLKNLFRLMIEYSDNTASDLVLKSAGGPAEIMKFLKIFDYLTIDISRSVSQLFKDKASGHQALLTDARDSGTPREMVKLISQVVDGKILNAASSKFLLECMYHCKTGNARIRALLPEGTAVASKTGTAIGFVNDIGLIDLPSQLGRLIVAVYIKNTTSSLSQSEHTIANIARVIYDGVLEGAQ